MNAQTAPVSSQSKEFDNVKRLPHFNIDDHWGIFYHFE